jgi:hypothetical protein
LVRLTNTPPPIKGGKEMAIHVYIDGEYHKRYETTQELNSDNLGKVAISRHDKRDDGDSNLFMITIKEEKTVSRIDEIKERCNKYEGEYFVSREEVEYLLSKLEIAQKALEKIENWGDDRPDCYPLYRIANDALQQLRT